METKHILWIAAAAGVFTGFFILSGGNTYGAGKWGQSTLGKVYSIASGIAPK